MKKTLTFIIIFAVVPALVLVGLAVANQFSQSRHMADTTPAGWNLGQASVRFDKATAVKSDLNLAADLANSPVPTNKWWESALTGDWPQTLFNLPWATQLSATGLGTGVPKVMASADQISAPYTADLILKSAVGTTLREAKVMAYDDVSVTLGVTNTDGQTAYTVRLVKGVPFLYVTLNKPFVLSAASGLTYRTLADGSQVVETSVNGQDYAAYLPVQAKVDAQAAQLKITPSSGGTTLTLAALPASPSSDVRARYDAAASAVVIGGQFAYSVDGQKVTSTIDWHVKGLGDPLYLALPAQTGAANGKTSLGTFTTLRGTAQLLSGRQLLYTQTTPETADLANLPTDDSFFTKATLETYLQATAATPPTVAHSSYDGGKELFRLANLLIVAKQAGSPTATAFQSQLRSELVNWYTYTPGEPDRYFYYDAKIHGLVAAPAQYGSETFNDHHFHYGYFLYASSVLGRYDSNFVQNYGAMADLLARDIADTNRDDASFPYLRVFDAYEGHSWADGLNQFADGNNQESVSEAANAWYGLMLWGKVRGNDEMATTGQALYTNETTAAMTYYYANAANPFPAGYARSEVSILWGGKAVYSTFFSALPEAKHGILMLPISGGSLYLNTNDNLKANLAALNDELGGKSPSTFGDVFTMARALTDPATARAAFSPTATLDNSNSLPFIYYWLGWAGQRGSK